VGSVSSTALSALAQAMPPQAILVLSVSGNTASPEASVSSPSHASSQRERPYPPQQSMMAAASASAAGLLGAPGQQSIAAGLHNSPEPTNNATAMSVSANMYKAFKGRHPLSRVRSATSVTTLWMVAQRGLTCG